MKPLLLRFQAFGPYREQQIVDFSALSEHGGLFLIHGQTGAGKTSILDAMCFALFGQASGIERKADGLRSVLADPDLPTEVTFEFSLGQDVYKVTRRPNQIVRKSRGEGLKPERSGGEIWKKEGGTWSHLAAGDRKTDEQIRDRLGMTEEQFRQVVVLPQGQFRKFLSATSDEREMLLEKLFRTDRLRRIERTLDDRAKVLASAVSDDRLVFSTRLKNLGVEKESELPALKESLGEQLANLVKDVSGFDQDFESAREISQLFEREATLSKEVERLRLESKAETERASEAARELQQATAERTRLQAQRGEIEKKSNDIAELEAIYPRAKRLHELRAEARDAENQHESASRSLNDQTKLLADVESEVKTFERSVENLQVDVAKVSGLRAGERIHASERQGLLALRVTAQELQEQAAVDQQLEADLSDLRQRFEMHLNLISKKKIAYHLAEAHRIAEHLQEGAPCPVCGSDVHPKLAMPPLEVVSAEDLEQLDATTAALNEQRLREETKRAAIQARLQKSKETLIARWPEKAASVNDLHFAKTAKTWIETSLTELDTLIKSLHADLQTAEAAEKKSAQTRTRLNDARTRLEVERKRQQDLGQALQTARVRFETARSNITELESSVPEQRRDLEALVRLGRELRADVKSYQQRLDEADQVNERAQHSSAATAARVQTLSDEIKLRLTTLDDVHAELRAKKTAQGLDRAAALQIFRDAEAKRTQARAERIALENRIQDVDAITAELAQASLRIREKEHHYKVVGHLAEAAGGRGLNRTRVNFQRYVLASRLDDVLIHASKRLLEMSRGQFLLKRALQSDDKRRSAGLDLEVEDLLSGKTRSTSTLSGGEGFMASLALALGLADVVQSHLGGVRLEAVFVDEGFGTLDPEALELAMKTLIELQSGGRLVGIISHVPELKDMISRRLLITKTEDGSRVAWE